MTAYTPEALGQAIKSLRRAHGLSQEQLGERVGYQSGAAVSISRLENGLVTPRPERLERIARALAIDPAELAALALEKVDGTDRLEDRVAQVRQELDRRTRLITESIDAYNAAIEHATSQFLIPLRSTAARLGVPQPDPTEFNASEAPLADRARADASAQLQVTKFGVEHALAQATSGARTAAPDISDTSFAEAVALGMATALGSVAPNLASARVSSANTLAAASRVLRPTMRGASANRGTAVIAVIGVGVLAAALGGLALLARRSRKQHQELAARVGEIEAEVLETQPSLDLLQELVPEATEVLNYIAVHAGHALLRWEAGIRPRATDWRSLDESDQRKYQEFVAIAAAQLAVATMDVEAILTCRGPDLDRVRAVTRELISQSRRTVSSFV